MTLIVDNIKTLIIDSTKEELKKMKAALSFKDSRTGFSKGGYNAMNIKTEKLYSSIKDGICVYNGVIDLISLLRSSSQKCFNNNNRVILDIIKKIFHMMNFVHSLIQNLNTLNIKFVLLAKC